MPGMQDEAKTAAICTSRGLTLEPLQGLALRIQRTDSMKALRLFFVAASFVLLSANAFAARKTVTLQVSGMVCPACPLAVRKALERVDGVLKADVSLERKEALVTFDDAKTNEQELIKATEKAGFPSSLTSQ